jgi:hypothetical protein
LKSPLAVIDCDCFQTFVVRENFFGKDTGKFFAKILLGVSYNIYSHIILEESVSESMNKADPHGSRCM